MKWHTSGRRTLHVSDEGWQIRKLPNKRWRLYRPSGFPVIEFSYRMLKQAKHAAEGMQGLQDLFVREARS